MKIISDKKTVLLISLLFTLYSCGGEDIVKNSDDPEEIIDDTLDRFVPDGYTKTWEDHFDGTEINTAHWTVGSLRDPETGDIIGILHLRWKRGNDGKCSYHSTWYDNPNDGFELIKDIQSKRVYKQHMLLEASKRKMFFMTGPKKDETFN